MNGAREAMRARVPHDVDLDATPDAISMRGVSKRLSKVAILDAAELCFATDGVDKAKMGAIARRAGVAVGTLYNYFDGRAELVTAVLERRHRELDDRLDQALTTCMPFPKAVETLIREVFEFCALHTAYFSLILRDEPSGHPVGMRSLHRHLRRVLDRGVEEGRTEPGNAALVADIALGCIRGSIIHTLEHREHGDPEVWVDTADKVTIFVLAGCA
jgi:AcrR family transcriptional regulator